MSTPENRSEIEGKTYTYSEILQKFFPNDVMRRLEKYLMQLFGMHEEWQHRMRQNEEYPLSGVVEVAKSGFKDKSSVTKSIEDFYRLEGFEIIQQEPLQVRDSNGITYRVSLLESESSWIVSVTAVPR